MKIAKDLEAGNDQNPSADADVALIYMGLGEPDQAMIWLNKAFEARFNPSILMRPAFDPLRSDARFQDLSAVSASGLGRLMSHHIEHTHADLFWHRRKPGRGLQNGTRVRYPLLPPQLHRRSAELIVF
jgi:hypothetical protein